MSVEYVTTTTGERLRTTQSKLSSAGDRLAELQTELGQLRRDFDVDNTTAADAEQRLSAMWTVADEAAGDVEEAARELSYVEDPDDAAREMGDEMHKLVIYVRDVARGIRSFDELQAVADRASEWYT